MPYKDPLRRRESARIRMQRFRTVHREDPKYKLRRKGENKRTWAKHREEYLQKHKEWYLKNREKQLIKLKKYCQENKSMLNEKKKEYNKTRRKTDPQFLVKSRLRCLIYNSVKLYGKGERVEKSAKYNLNLNDIAKHLNSNKPLDFNKRKYHIDHIKPVASFDLSKKEEIRKAFDKNNLQWLPALDNIKKSNKLIQ